MVVFKQLGIFALLSVSSLFTGTAIAKSDVGEIHASFIKRANEGNGVIKLNAADFDAITAPDREWNVAVHLTALGKEFKCEPCKYVFVCLLYLREKMFTVYFNIRVGSLIRASRVLHKRGGKKRQRRRGMVSSLRRLISLMDRLSFARCVFRDTCVA